MKLLEIFILLTFPTFIIGQTKFEINNGSKKYKVKIESVECDNGTCSGKGVIVLTKKQNSKFIQKLISDDLYFNLDNSQQPTVNIIQLYNEQSPVIFEDFNFDGNEDLAIRNGNNSGYGGPSYDVYVFNITRNKFVLSDELTDLATENLGMFQTDSKRKRLITFAKSGCCWHITTEYKIIPKKGLQKVYEVEEDATNSNGQYVKVITRNLINNKWIEKSKKFKIEDYYKE